jgi:hypothetical protein
MVFCGKCGYRLTSGDTVCPRCGTPTDPDLILDDSQADSPTIASSPMQRGDQTQPKTQGPISPGTYAQQAQEPLILGPNGGNYGAAEQMADQTTTQAPNMAGQTPARTLYPGYVPQGMGNYPQQRASYPGYAPQGDARYQTIQGQGGFASAKVARNRARGRLVGLLLILLGLLLILGAMVLFIFTHNTSTSAYSSTQQALSVIGVFHPWNSYLLKLLR